VPRIHRSVLRHLRSVCVTDILVHAYAQPAVAIPPVLPSLPSSMTETTAPTSSCWECTRRGLTCDGLRPVCKTCQEAQIVCPGYKDQKALTWLVPGKTKSWTWKKNRLKAGSTANNSIDPDKDAMRVPRPATAGHSKRQTSAKIVHVHGEQKKQKRLVPVPSIPRELLYHSEENEMSTMIHYCG
jgi:hypothetical protein